MNLLHKYIPANPYYYSQIMWYKTQAQSNALAHWFTQIKLHTSERAHFWSFSEGTDD